MGLINVLMKFGKNKKETGTEGNDANMDKNNVNSVRVADYHQVDLF